MIMGRNARGSHHSSSAATVETWDMDGSLMDQEPFDENMSPTNKIEIEGMELLSDSEHVIMFDPKDKEVDSLVLARRRLPRIWINNRTGKFASRGRVRLRELQDWCRPRTRARNPIRHEVKKVCRMPSMESVELTTSDMDDDSSEYSVSSWANMTVDSLVLTRKRFAADRRNKNRTRKQGKDLLILGTQLNTEHSRGFQIPVTAHHVPKMMENGHPLLRSNSEGLAKLRGASRSSPGKRIIRHSSTGRMRMRAGRSP